MRQSLGAFPAVSSPSVTVLSPLELAVQPYACEGPVALDRAIGDVVEFIAKRESVDGMQQGPH